MQRFPKVFLKEYTMRYFSLAALAAVSLAAAWPSCAGATKSSSVAQSQNTPAPTATRVHDTIPMIVFDSPYEQRAQVYRGQLHAHTTNSDGTQSPAAVMTAYRAAGYDFVAITDHNVHTSDPKVSGVLFIPGVENDHGCQHENRIDVGSIAPGARVSQDVIDRARSEGSFVQINHPDWPGSYPKNPCWSDKALLALHDYDAVEVWNASDDDTNNNAEIRIDTLLSEGRRTFLTAVDDCHDVRAAYCMTSSVYVFANALSKSEVMTGLRQGNFYASSGALISEILVDRGVITVTVPTPSQIEFIANCGRVVKNAPNVLGANYAANGSEKTIRMRVTAPNRRRAWTNPLYVVTKQTQ